MEQESTQQEIDELLTEAKEIQQAFKSARGSEKVVLYSRYEEIDQKLTKLKKGHGTSGMEWSSAPDKDPPSPSAVTSNTADITTLIGEDVYLLGKKISENNFKFLAYRCMDNHIAIDVWTTEEALTAWYRHNRKESPWFQASARAVLISLLNTKQIEYLVLNPDPTCPTPPSTECRIASLPGEKLFHLHDVKTMTDILCRYGASEVPPRVRNLMRTVLTRTIQEHPNAACSEIIALCISALDEKP